MNMDTMYDDVARLQGNDGLRAIKRAFGAPVAIISADWAVNKYVLENVDKYSKGEFLRESMFPLLGDGIFNVDGAKWLEQRKAASFMFAKRELKAMVGVFVRHFAGLDRLLEDGRPVEFQALASAYTLDCFCELAFGLDTGALRGESVFGTAFNDAQAATLQRFVFFPWWKWLPSFVFPHERRLCTSVAKLDAIIFALVRERRQDPELAKREDLLSRLLQNDGFCDDRYVRDAVLNFILVRVKKDRVVVSHILSRLGATRRRRPYCGPCTCWPRTPMSAIAWRQVEFFIFCIVLTFPSGRVRGAAGRSVVFDAQGPAIHRALYLRGAEAVSASAQRSQASDAGRRAAGRRASLRRRDE
jgi:hypothetical protein